MRLDQKKMLQLTVLVSGVLFISVGALGLMFIDRWPVHAGLDDMTAKIVCSALFIVGMVDLLLARYVFNTEDRR